MRVFLLLLVLLLGYSQYSDAQRGRRGRRGGKKTHELQILKNICCYFVNDNAYTTVSKYRYREDAILLTQRFLLERGDTLTVDSVAGTHEELIMHFYNLINYVRLGDDPQVQDFCDLGIHVDYAYGKVQTSLEWQGGEHYQSRGMLIYTIRYGSATKSWAVYTDMCPGEISKVKTLKNDPIPTEILTLQRTIGRAELKETHQGKVGQE